MAEITRRWYWWPLVIGICLQQYQYAATAATAIDDSQVDINWQSGEANAHTSRRPLAPNVRFALNEFATHTVIAPQILHGKHKRPLHSTLNPQDGLHEAHITLTYYHGGERVYADLHRNDDLLPREHFLRYQNRDRSIPAGLVLRNFTKTELDLCHYQGRIRGRPKSSVAVSTCSGGINGIVFDGSSGDTFYIHSGRDGRLQDEHFLLHHSERRRTNHTCAYSSDKDNYQADAAPLGHRSQRITRHKRSYDENNVIRGPYNANKHSSYVELVIVVDNKVYKSFGENTKRVHQHCKDLANIINALYVPLNIFIALIGVVIWNESNEIEFSADGDVTLRNFLNYRRTKLVLEHPNDNAQLLTKEQFIGGVVGKALKGPICTHEYSGGVSMEHSQIIAVVATTMAHEMGHNFGMEHDSPDCKCRDEKCIMSASSTSVVPVHWSSCSIDQLNIAFSRGMNYCLRNKPAKLFDSPQCGNGFVEPGEQCDCGLPSYCENTCCDPQTCMLHVNASCATGECCDLNTCRPKVAGTVCRSAENECDLPEYCTGESEYCPGDVFKRDTEDCDNAQAYCYQGNCRSHSNQCRILWGPTGESSEHCYWKNIEGKRGGNCGYNRINNTFVACEKEHVGCGMLHCRHLNERLEFGMESAAVVSHSFINHNGNIVPCRTALVDLGLQSTDPGLTPNGAKCGNGKMCINQQCHTVAEVQALGRMGKRCPDDCKNYGVCNSRGNCHCNIGYTGASCQSPGPGGSSDSGPATNPNSHDSFKRFMYIFFFCVLPLIFAFCFGMYYCRQHPSFLRNKLAENILKSAGGNKQAAARHAHHNHPGGPLAGGGGSGAHSLPKSTPSSTDDMNSALLKSPSESLSNGSMFGKFKGFTLRPLNDNATTHANGPNVAYVQPTVQDSGSGVPQRVAPPPPPVVKTGEGHKGEAAPALPPPNPGSNARPIISMPVLETSTLTLPLKQMHSGEGGGLSPARAAPRVPSPGSQAGTLKPSPSPPVPLHADPKLNGKRDGTIRRIASFLKKEEKPPAKEKTYIDREKLRNIEISAPLPVPNGESSDSEPMSPRDDEIKNLVKRTQSMRSPTKKAANIQSFGSMRYAGGAARPKSIVTGANARPKSPPPRPPPLLRKAESTTSSGYQLPVATAKTIAENAYDDCEFVEVAVTAGADEIYSVIDEIPPAAQTLRRSDLVSDGSTASDIGLLGEIVSEIEKRNGDSLYSATAAAAATLASPVSPSKAAAATLASPVSPSKAAAVSALEIGANKAKAAAVTSPGAGIEAIKTNTPTVAPVAAYLRPTPLNAPVARVAPTRADSLTSPTISSSPSSLFSSFKPGPAAKGPAATQLAATHQRSGSTANAAQKSNKFVAKAAKPPAAGTAAALPSATIQKPKPLSAKPSFGPQLKKPPLGGGQARQARTISNIIPAPNTPNITATAGPGAPVTPPIVKPLNVAALSRRFERDTGDRNGSNT